MPLRPARKARRRNKASPGRRAGRAPAAAAAAPVRRRRRSLSPRNRLSRAWRPQSPAAAAARMKPPRQNRRVPGSATSMSSRSGSKEEFAVDERRDLALCDRLLRRGSNKQGLVKQEGGDETPDIGRTIWPQHRTGTSPMADRIMPDAAAAGDDLA